MIIIRLVGGLGNQMFQYALGRQLSLIHNRPLHLDKSGYTAAVGDPQKGIRLYGLGHFNIDEHFATTEELEQFVRWRRQTFGAKIRRRLFISGAYYKQSYIVEPLSFYFRFNERLLQANLKPTVYLDGYWQAEKYFSGIQDIIHKDFTFKNLPNGENRRLAAEIERHQSISIHIRHGDNATSAGQKHGVLPLAYYSEAIRRITATIQDPHFYVFSDGHDWVRQHLKLEYPMTMVTHNGDDKNYEDMRLISLCKHHIIGNSTFSWWGAWLGKHPKQIVFAPKEYHLHTNILPVDFYPQDWNIISVKNIV